MSRTPPPEMPRPVIAGIVAGSPFVFVVIPFGTLFGVVATEAGMDLLHVMSFSILVVAGASQFAALQLMLENAPTLVVIVSALVVNLRMAMYSAAITPYLGEASSRVRMLAGYFLTDQSYAVAVARFDEGPPMPLPTRVAFYFGTVIPVAPLWYASTLAGALIGTNIPESLALDFAVPICFLAIIGPALRTKAHMVAAGVSVSLALALAWMPWNIGLLFAAGAAMAAGAEVERRSAA